MSLGLEADLGEIRTMTRQILHVEVGADLLGHLVGKATLGYTARMNTCLLDGMLMSITSTISTWRNLRIKCL